MVRSAARRAEDAADALLAWLDTQPRQPRPAEPRVNGEDGFPGGTRTDASPLPESPDGTAPSRLDSRPAVPAVGAVGLPGTGQRGAALRPRHTDWLYHRLTVTGHAEAVAAFRHTAAGAGVVPWDLDLDRMEEDLFHRLLASPPRTLSISGARVLAAELREAAGGRHAAATARVGWSRACPFDLHALLPVPDAVLRLGPDHPNSLLWLWEHWGSFDALRHVSEVAPDAREKSAPAGDAVFHVRFWSADWTPWRALAQVAASWPALRLDVTPVYDGP